MKHVPASILSANVNAFAKSFVNTPEAKLNSVAFAHRRTYPSCLQVEKEEMIMIGPKVSPLAMYLSSSTCVNIVGMKNRPARLT